MTGSVIINLTGAIFGRLRVTSFAGMDRWGRARWNCRCRCGSSLDVASGNLRSGNTQSCGCLQRERRIVHGQHKTSTYKVWTAMLQRCGNPRHPSWEHYGGRGITVCARWRDFGSFLADMGEKPRGKSIERIDNDSGYNPDNCRWASWPDQARNKRNTIFVTICGERLPMVDACRRAGIDPDKPWSRKRVKRKRPITITEAFFDLLGERIECTL